MAKAVEAAKSAADLAAALDPIVDERGSPKKHEVAAGTPILQPTDERRRTGSHYTPRSLTEPIVRYALEPASSGSGQTRRRSRFSISRSATRPWARARSWSRPAARSRRGWSRRGRAPDEKPTIPPDEDEELHARRLVAQRCLYGVDKNPLAADLAKLSLWLATLARDHEFTFLDHALNRRQPGGADAGADRGGALGPVEARPAAVPATGEGPRRRGDERPRRNPAAPDDTAPFETRSSALETRLKLTSARWATP